MSQAKNAGHGITLEKMLVDLVAFYGWPDLGRRIDIRCFQVDPNIKSSLTFLRRTPWARDKVEGLYGKYLRDKAKQEKQAAVAEPDTGTSPDTTAS